MNLDQYDQLSEYEQNQLFSFGFKSRFDPQMHYYRCPQCRYSKWHTHKQQLICTDERFGNCQFVRAPGAD